MVIAITEGMKEIEPALHRAGHSVVTYGHYAGAVDAVVYRGSLLTGGTAMSNHKDGGGILMVNAENRSIDEIINGLKYKTYSPLF